MVASCMRVDSILGRRRILGVDVGRRHSGVLLVQDLQLDLSGQYPLEASALS